MSTARPGLPVTWLVGRRVRLRPLESSDIPFVRRLRLDVPKKSTAFVIQLRDGRDVGAVGITVDGPLAGLSIALRDARHLADGVAADALRVMKAGALRSLPLVRIEALVDATDRERVVAYRKAGFAREGVLRAALRVGRGYRDAVLLSFVTR